MMVVVLCFENHDDGLRNGADKQQFKQQKVK